MVRDDAELLGCQFRTIRKSELAQPEIALEKLYDLAVCYPDSQRLNAFVVAWGSALESARASFLRTIRSLDLPDYANMQALILDAEGQPVGDYVIDLYDLYLHNVIEGNAELIRAAKGLNNIAWNEYPPAHFMPSAEVVAIMDGAIFHNERRTQVEAEIDNNPMSIHFGDVFLAGKVPANVPVVKDLEKGNASEPAEAHAEAPPAKALGRHAYMVMSQACDLMRGGSDRALLLRGEAKAYEWRQHDNRKATPKTPIMIVGQEKFVVEWDLLAPETWQIADLPGMIADSGFKLARRFRPSFALQLQHSFLSGLGRIGTLATVPARYPTDVYVYLKSSAGKAKLIAQSKLENEDAVCLVGRTANKLKEWLLLSERFRRTLRDAFVAAKANDPAKNAKSFLEAVDNPGFYRLFTAGLIITRDGSGTTRPFKDKPFDFVQVSTKVSLRDGDDIANNTPPVLIEVDLR